MNKRNLIGSLLGFLGFSKAVVPETIVSEVVIPETVVPEIVNTDNFTESNQQGEREIEQRNGFGEPFSDGKVGDGVSCLQFTYEVFSDNRKRLISAVILKGIIVSIEKDFYAVKMAYYKEALPEHYLYKHVLPLDEEEYKAARPCQKASCGNYTRKAK